MDFENGTVGNAVVAFGVAAPCARRHEPAIDAVKGLHPCIRIGGVLSPGIRFCPVFDKAAVFVKDRVPFVSERRSAFVFGIDRAAAVAPHRRSAQGIGNVAALICLAEDEARRIQAVPADVLCHCVIRDKQTVGIGIAVLPCGVGRSRCRAGRTGHAVGRRFQNIGIHRSRIGKRDIVQRAVGQRAVHRTGDALARKVKVIFPAGGEVKLLCRRFLHRETDAEVIAGIVGLIVAVILLGKHRKGIFALCKSCGDGKFRRAVFRLDRLHAATVAEKVLVLVKKNGGDIFVVARLGTRVVDPDRSAVGRRGDIRGQNTEIPAGRIKERQLPFVAAVCGNRRQPLFRAACGLAARGGGDHPHGVFAQVEGGTRRVDVVDGIGINDTRGMHKSSCFRGAADGGTEPPAVRISVHVCCSKTGSIVIIADIVGRFPHRQEKQVVDVGKTALSPGQAV